jgi:hypothetical protein
MRLHDGRDEVFVYQYMYWDEPSREKKTSKHYATLGTIRNGLGIPVFTSEKRVAASEVVDGFLHEAPERRR